MLQDVFTSKEMVKVVDVLLDDPSRAYNKSELATAAGVSRPTLDRLLRPLLRLRVLAEDRGGKGAIRYRLASGSAIVGTLLRFDNELAKTMAVSGLSTPESPRGRRVRRRRSRIEVRPLPPRSRGVGVRARLDRRQA